MASGTIGAQTLDFDSDPFHLESIRQLTPHLHGFEICILDVHHGLALGANQVMVRVRVNLDPQRTVMRTQLAHDPMLHKRVKRFVNRGL